jgi:hypothetical protein
MPWRRITLAEDRALRIGVERELNRIKAEPEAELGPGLEVLETSRADEISPPF